MLCISNHCVYQLLTYPGKPLPVAPLASEGKLLESSELSEHGLTLLNPFLARWYYQVQGLEDSIRQGHAEVLNQSCFTENWVNIRKFN